MQSLASKQLSILMIHGWGLSSAFFSPLISGLTPFAAIDTLNLGFQSSSINYSAIDANKKYDIIIAHSLGGLFALHHDIKPSKAAFFINSFYDFSPFSSKETLLQMQKTLDKNPAIQMRRFLKQAQCLDYIEKDTPWNQENLVAGLNSLINWHERPTINNWQNNKVKIISLIGANDPICNSEAMKKHWSNTNTLYINKEAGHALPQTHANWCLDQIINIIKSHDD